MVGGSSSLNGMLYMRGDPTDFDDWAQAGAPGWSYADLEPYFRRIERYVDGDAPHLGDAGPLHLESRFHHGTHPASVDFVAAAERRGHRHVDSFDGPDGVAGCGFFLVNIRDGRRFGAREAYLESVLSRDTLTLWPDTRVVRLNLERGRCVGVTVVRDGAPTVVRATREVVLASGAAESPKLLMLSGIGGEQHLRDVGVPVRHALEGVGENFHDHVAVGVEFEKARDVQLSDFLGDAAVFHRSTREWVGADLETLLAVQTFEDGELAGGLSMRTALLRPMSRGTVRLHSADPEAPPLLDPRFLSADSDVERLATGVREALGIASTDPLSSWIDGLGDNAGLNSAMTDTGLYEWVQANAVSFWHIAGGCRMGLDERAVVDAELRVHGVGTLRVVDASVMPSVPSGHNQAAVLAIAERASDLLLGRRPLAAGA
jgi:choline dehydrogenase